MPWPQNWLMQQPEVLLHIRIHGPQLPAATGMQAQWQQAIIQLTSPTQEVVTPMLR